MRIRLKNKSTICFAAAAAALILCLVLVYRAFGPKAHAGDKQITVEVTHKDGSVKEFVLNTEAGFLRKALEEKKLIAGTDDEFGLFVLTVDGETVSSDAGAQEWWNFLKGGEYLMTGVDTTPIADGDHFEIIFTTGWQ